jgi:hypothetical protein
VSSHVEAHKSAERAGTRQVRPLLELFGPLRLRINTERPTDVPRSRSRKRTACPSQDLIKAIIEISQEPTPRSPEESVRRRPFRGRRIRR